METTRDVPGVRLFELRVGSGPEVTALHGGPGASHDYLRPGFDRLARGRTVVYYDQRGGGRSPVARDVPVGWREHVADLEALRGAWGLERLDIAGYSWGGLLALLYASEHPERVGKLALISPAPAWREAREEFERRFQARTLAPALQAERERLRESGLRDRDLAAWQRRLFDLSVAGYFHNPAKVVEMTPFRVTGRTQQEVWASLGDFDLRPRLAGLRVEAIVLHGDDDPIPVESARTVAELLAAPFHLVPDCGHVPHVEAPEEFADVLGSFFR